jgi:hypothetical protein
MGSAAATAGKAMSEEEPITRAVSAASRIFAN